jgi:hypothetical protein
MTKRRKRIALIFSGILLLSMLMGDRAFAQSGKELVIRHVEFHNNDNDQVATADVYFSVTDTGGKVITGIDRTDLELFVDGKPVTGFQVEKAPINLVILIDTSELTELSKDDNKDRLREAQDEISANLDTMLPENSWVKIYEYNKDHQEIVGATMNLEQAANVLKGHELILGPYPCFFSVIDIVTKTLDMPPDLPTIIVAIINGKMTRNTFQEAHECDLLLDTFTKKNQLYASKPAIFMIPYYSALKDETGLSELKELADNFGWEYFLASKPDGLSSRLLLVGENLPTGYILSFPTDMQPHQVRITAKKLGVESDWQDVNFLPIPSIRFENLVNDQKINAGPITIHIGLKDLPNNVGSIKLDIAEDPKLEVITPGDTQLQIPLDFSGYSGQDILLKAVLLDNEGKEIALAEPVRVSVAVSNGVPGDDNLGLTPTSTQVMMEEEQIIENTSVAPWLGIGIGVILFFLLFLLVLVGFLLYRFHPPLKHFIQAKIIPYINNIINWIKRLGSKAAGLNRSTHPTAREDGGKVLYQLTILKNPQASMVGRLLSISSEEFSIGRDPGNDLPIPGDRQVSRLHVMLVARMGTVHLVEQGRILPDGSRISPLHGTFVDGKRMTRDVRLYDGNMIGLGQSTIFSIKLDVE